MNQKSRIEDVVLGNLLYNEDYLKKVLPFIKGEYFSDVIERSVFEKILSFVNGYGTPPTVKALRTIFNQTSFKQESIDRVTEILDSLEADVNDPKMDEKWLLETTEKWCKDQAIYNAVAAAVEILDPKTKTKMDKGSIPELLQKALSVGFSSEVGHDYTESAKHRFKFYHMKEEKLPFDLKYLNKITNGGIPNKSLNVLLAGTGVGKTLAMCHFATSYLKSGRNVLYITLEMSEERIAERIDANLLDTKLQDLVLLSETSYFSKVDKAKNNFPLGKIIIKEYPTATANVNHFRTLLNELKLKKDFKPDVIIIDYLNIALSSRIKQSPNVTSYTYIKAIAEELRGLAVEQDLPIITATQTNRQGFVSSDLGLENTSESFGLPATADLVLGIISTEELDKQGQYLFKQLKNRYNDPTKNRRFLVGVDKGKMRLFDVEDKAQKDIVDSGSSEDDDTPAFDKSRFGEGMKAETTYGSQTRKRSYSSKDFKKINT